MYRHWSEVVVTGMAENGKRLFTGAGHKTLQLRISSCGTPEISRALEGRAAGVSVQNVSGTFGTALKPRTRSNFHIR